MDRQIRVGITHGDYNGVGYEVIFKALAQDGASDVITDMLTPVVFGLPAVANEALRKFELPNIKLNIVKRAGDAKSGRINVVDISEEPESQSGNQAVQSGQASKEGENPVQPGQVSKEAGESAVKALERAVEALKAGEIDVLVTAPISKEAVQSQKFNFPGHTEYLTDRLGEGSEAQMILCNDSLRVALLTKHIPISQIAENITKEKLVEAVEKFTSTLKKDFGIVKPAVAVLSLNPHAGDGGLLGKEEEEIIKPALEELLQNGYLAFGPFAADGFFGHGTYKKFDGVLAMYHDQGLAPFKTLATSGGVNFSAGLPYVRTSPDHGTAFDIAWQNVADAKSMRDAIYMAVDVFKRRKTFEHSASNPLKKYVHERPERGERQDRPDRPEKTDRPEKAERSRKENTEEND